MMSLQFNGLWPWWLVLIVGIAGACLIGRWYYRESRFIRRPMTWLLPLLRGIAFLLILLMLAGPVLVHRTIEGELSLIRVLLDGSRSMSIADLPENRNVSKPRFAMALDWLLQPVATKDSRAGFLERLRENHRIEWYLCGADGERNIPPKLLWDSTSNASLPKTEGLEATAPNSSLGEALTSSLTNKPAAIVILTDGQNNVGIPWNDAATTVSNAGVPVFAIGFGSLSEPNDFAVLKAEHSGRVFRTDRLRGTVSLKEQADVGTAYRVIAKHLGKVVWAKELTSTRQSLRRIEFDIPAEVLVDAAKVEQSTGFDYSLVPIDLGFSIVSEIAEVATENNRFETSLWGISRKNRVLLLDRRGGWETRYIKNALQRDASWDASVAIGPTSFAGEFFPKTRDALFEFDLVILTLESVSELQQSQLDWLNDFVSVSGGGLILLDSNRPLSEKDKDAVANLLPVQWQDTPDTMPMKSVKLAAAANDQPAFQLGTTPESNPQIWGKLPPPKSMRSVTLAPVAEALVEAVSASEANNVRPLMATKLYGQGRVLYSASDETWRWRYNVADLYHQRFWNQIATWTMRAPFAVNDSFASLDTGLRMISSEEVVTIRAKLKQDDSNPLENATVQAVLEKEGQRVASVPLTQELDARGFYRATVGPFAVGSYDVRLEAAGIPRGAIKVSSQFVVQAPMDIEMNMLACNPVALKQIADATGGEFAMIDDAETIYEKLKQFRTGKVIESQTLLWQSYPWFVTIMMLLALEWYLRKRVGLI